MRGKFVKKIERPKGYVNIDEVYEALNEIEKEEDCEYGDYGEVLSKWATCDYGEILNAISCCDVINAIPLDRIKQAREEIQKCVDILSDDTVADVNMKSGLGIALEKIDRLIESEEINGKL